MKKFINIIIFLIFLTCLMLSIGYSNALAVENPKYKIAVDTFVNPSCEEYKSYIYYPEGIYEKKPVVFFFHGYGGTDPDMYKSLIDHIVSDGNILVYVPYPSIPLPINEEAALKKYNILLTGINEAAKKFSYMMNLDKVGFVGHSFGAGAIPYIAKKSLFENKWGKSGSFLYMMAPWYSFGINTDDLKNFPSDTKLLMEVFNNDSTNDHRMAKDIFENISIPDSSKTYVVLYSDYSSDHILNADHLTPLGSKYDLDEDNELDIEGIFKLFDNLAEYTFNNGKSIKDVTSISDWLHVYDMPIITHPQSFYDYKWTSFLNPRHESSELVDKDFKIWSTDSKVSPDKKWIIKFNSPLNPKTVNPETVCVMNSLGYPIRMDLLLSNDNCSIIATPEENYDSNETYTLYINKGIYSQSGHEVNYGYELKFSIKNDY